MKKALVFVCFAFGMAAVSCSPGIDGTWIEKSRSSEESGFTLYKDGTAASINQGSLEIKNWEKIGDTLVIKGNITYSKKEFADKMKIEKVTKTELVLSQDNTTLNYRRK